MYKTKNFAVHLRLKKTKKGKLAVRRVAVRANSNRAVVLTTKKAGVFVVNGKPTKLKVNGSVNLIGGGKLVRTSKSMSRVIGSKRQIVSIRRIRMSKTSVVFRVAVVLRKVGKKSSGFCVVAKSKKFAKGLFPKKFRAAPRTVVKKCTIAQRKAVVAQCKTITKGRVPLFGCIISKCQGSGRVRKPVAKKPTKKPVAKKPKPTKKPVTKKPTKKSNKGKKNGKKFRKLTKFGRKIRKLRKLKKFGKLRKLLKKGKRAGKKIFKKKNLAKGKFKISRKRIFKKVRRAGRR
jgi:hypothetical protein